MHITAHMRRLLTFGFASLCLTGLLSACTSTAERAARRAAAHERADLRIRMYRMPIPATSFQLQATFAHPQETIRQSFKWAPNDNEWRVTMYSDESRYAGFHVRRALNVEDMHHEMVLHFDLWPIEAAHEIFLAIGNDTRTGHKPLLAMTSVSRHPIVRQDDPDWGTYAIPLTEFEQHIVHADTWEKTESARIDWSRIYEIRLVRRADPTSESQLIIIRNLEIAPKHWVRYE